LLHGFRNVDIHSEIYNFEDVFIIHTALVLEFVFLTLEVCSGGYQRQSYLYPLSPSSEETNPVAEVFLAIFLFSTDP
jgi:hypothetical protein